MSERNSTVCAVLADGRYLLLGHRRTKDEAWTRARQLQARIIKKELVPGRLLHGAAEHGAGTLHGQLVHVRARDVVGAAIYTMHDGALRLDEPVPLQGRPLLNTMSEPELSDLEARQSEWWT